MEGIAGSVIVETPLAIVDVETTGLHPNGDSIVEVGVVRVDPGVAPVVVLDSLVNPRRQVAGTEIHGITDEDVKDAPTFPELLPALLDAFNGAVLAAYNVYFDVRFLQTEMSQAGVHSFPPHLCLMYMRPLLELGKRCSLTDACAVAGIDVGSAHVAADDALLGAALWRRYESRMEALGISQFRELAALRAYKFFASFSSPLIDHRSATAVRVKSRRVEKGAPKQGHFDHLREYWSALKSALADLQFSDDEVSYLQEKSATLQLTKEEIRWLHARAFAGVLAGVSDDELITDAEVQLVFHISEGLRKLGWAPGDPAEGSVLPPKRRSGVLSRFWT